MSTTSQLGRPPERIERIVRELRGRITGGDWGPGTQLPTRADLEMHFGVASDTLQRALHELKKDGFIAVKGRQGTFVAAKPPHLTNYALVFPGAPDGMNRFFSALNVEAAGIATSLGREISVYYGAESQEGFRRLLADVKAHRLGGIIFTSVPGSMVGTPILDEPGIPRVIISGPGSSHTIPRVGTSMDSFWDLCGDELEVRGRKQVALLLPPFGRPEIQRITERLQARGFHVPRKWVHVVPRQYPESAGNLVELLFDGHHERPDALVIADDNPVEYAIAGLINAKVRVSDEVDVIAHCNFPHPVPSPLPIRRLGFDVRGVLKSCFSSLDRIRAGEEVGGTQIQAVFETL